MEASPTSPQWAGAAPSSATCCVRSFAGKRSSHGVSPDHASTSFGPTTMLVDLVASCHPWLANGWHHLATSFALAAICAADSHGGRYFAPTAPTLGSRGWFGRISA